MTSYTLVEECQSFGGTCSLHFQGGRVSQETEQAVNGEKRDTSIGRGRNPES